MFEMKEIKDQTKPLYAYIRRLATS